MVDEFSLRTRSPRLVVSAFAEEGWPKAIYNPLETVHSARATVKNLNLKQNEIIFHYDHQQEIIWWRRPGEPRVVPRLD